MTKPLREVRPEKIVMLDTYFGAMRTNIEIAERFSLRIYKLLRENPWLLPEVERRFIELFGEEEYHKYRINWQLSEYENKIG